MARGIYRELSVTLSEFYVCCIFMYTPCSKLTNCYISARMLSAMAAGDTSQTTPAQIVHIFVLCCSTQIVGVLQF